MPGSTAAARNLSAASANPLTNASGAVLGSGTSTRPAAARDRAPSDFVDATAAHVSNPAPSSDLSAARPAGYSLPVTNTLVDPKAFTA